MRSKTVNVCGNPPLRPYLAGDPSITPMRLGKHQSRYVIKPKCTRQSPPEPKQRPLCSGLNGDRSICRPCWQMTSDKRQETSDRRRPQPDRVRQAQDAARRSTTSLQSVRRRKGLLDVGPSSTARISQYLDKSRLPASQPTDWPTKSWQISNSSAELLSSPQHTWSFLTPLQLYPTRYPAILRWLHIYKWAWIAVSMMDFKGPSTSSYHATAKSH